ncbi:hypothetical protein H4582DRAFT_1908658 [Lactarius indigo]|nr:hypothetical protein H4582DRAFT_1908658 [Lactarius indigo]
MAKSVYQLIPLFILATLLLPLPLSILETRSSSNDSRSVTDRRPRSDGPVRCSCCMCVRPPPSGCQNPMYAWEFFFYGVVFSMLHDTAWPPPIYL